jgi:hypothetical protein
MRQGRLARRLNAVAVDAASRRPARSPTANAVAALVRELDDDRAVRANPLVAAVAAPVLERGGDIDDVVELVRAAVRRTLTEASGGANGAVSQRAARIVARCDGAGEAHPAVMRDMALSRAEFYRQLAAGRQGLALELHRRTAAAARHEPDPFDSRLASAYALALTGRLDDALAFLRPSLDRIRGLERVRIACVLAEFCLDGSRGDDARSYARIAAAAALALDGDAAEIAQAHLAYVDVSLAFKDVVAGGVRLDAHIDRLRPLAQRNDPSAVDVLSQLIILKATREAYGGAFERAFTILQSSPSNDPFAPVARTTRAEHLMRVASIRMLLPQPLDAALDDCRRLHRYAAAHGFARMVTAALADRAAIAAIRGESQRALGYAGDAIASSRAFLVPWDHAGVCTMAASVALDAGQPETARAFAVETRRYVAGGTFPALLSRIYDADAVSAGGRPRDGLHAVLRVERTLADGAFPGLAGRAAYVKSRAYRALGDSRRALTAARESVEILAASGHRYALLRSLELAAAIAPDAALQRRAAELHATL